MTMSFGRRLAVSAAAVAAACAWACSSPKPAPPPPPAPTVASGLTSPYGPVTALVSVKELMQNMIDPLGDYIFDAVWWDITPKGTIAHAPETDEDWDKVKTGAVSLAVNNSTGPNPPELSPTEIQAKIDKDPVLWQAKIEGLRNVSKEVLDIVARKDTKALFAASEDLDKACEACHLEYWYPGDRKAVEEDARQHARFENPAKKK
jgi:hypothetical protein